MSANRHFTERQFLAACFGGSRCTPQLFLFGCLMLLSFRFATLSFSFLAMHRLSRCPELHETVVDVGRNDIPIPLGLLWFHQFAIMIENHLRTISHLQANACSVLTLSQPIRPIAMSHHILRPLLEVCTSLHRIESLTKLAGYHRPPKFCKRSNPRSKILRDRN